jgi:hypothetical protein
MSDAKVKTDVVTGMGLTASFIELLPRHVKSGDLDSDSYFLADSFLDSFLGEFLSSTAIR